MRHRAAARGAAATGAALAINAGAGLATLALLGNTGGTADVGSYAIFISVLAIGRAVGLFGFDRWLLLFDGAEAPYRVARRATLLCSPAVLAAAALTLVAAGGETWEVTLLMASIVFGVTAELRAAVATRELEHLRVARSFELPIGTSPFLFAATFHIAGLPALVGAEVGTLAGLSVAAALLGRSLRPGPVVEIRSAIRGALPFLWVTASSIAQGRAETVLTGASVGVQAAGAYQVALRTATAVHLPNTAIAAVARPRIARVTGPNDTQLLGRYIGLTWLASLPAPALGSAVLLGFGSDILGLFGSEFEQATNGLRWLAGAQFVRALLGPSSDVLIVLNKAGSVALGNVLGIASMSIAVVLFADSTTDVARVAALHATATSMAMAALLRHHVGYTMTKSGLQTAALILFAPTRSGGR